MTSSTDRIGDGIRMDARVIPVPASLSVEAQARLQAAVIGGVPTNAAQALPDPSDHDAWRALRVQVDAAYRTAPTPDEGRITTISLGPATVHVARPAKLVHPDSVYLDLHGGAFVFGGGEACRAAAGAAAALHGLCCHGVDYRMPPEHTFPAALDDSLAAYRRAIAEVGSGRVVIGGRSAGGNLALATVLRARDEGLPPPAGLVLLSPEVDLTESGDSFRTNRGLDVNLPGSLMRANLLYAGGADLAHPYLSPLFGRFAADFPPTFIQTGTRDLMLSNAVRLHRALREAGAQAELHVFEAMPHGGFGGTPEDQALSREIAGFVARALAPEALPRPVTSQSCDFTGPNPEDHA